MDQKLIFDVGMHTGEDTAHYLSKGFRVVAIEANPVLVATARERFADAISNKSLVVVPKAIGSDDATIPFHVHKLEPQWSSIFNDRWSPENTQYDTIQVECVNLSRLFQEYGVPRYCKIDIEGADHIALTHLEEVEIKPHFISIEGGPKQHVDQLLSLGYNRFKLIDQHFVHDASLPIGDGIEGSPTQPNFGVGRSGPFGLELPYEWLEADQVNKQFEVAWANRENHPIYFDIHATRI